MAALASDDMTGQASPAPSLAAASDALRKGLAGNAEAELLRLLSDDPNSVPGWLLLGKSRQMQSRFRDMLENAQEARRLAPTDQNAINLELEALVLCGEIQAVRDAVNDLRNAGSPDASGLARLAEVATQIGDQELAVSLNQAALALRPADTQLRFNLAAAQLALGHMGKAEDHLDAVVSAHPKDGDAWYNRSTLRRQTTASNHVAELKGVLPGIVGQAGEMPARFALAKELEDLGRYEESVHQLKTAAALRRAHMQYRVEQDCQTLSQITQTFDDTYARRPDEGHLSDSPILVTGLPRSGTTLVDRILSSHDDVASVGEVNDLPLAIMEECGSVQSKTELVEKSSAIEPAGIGRNYAQRLMRREPSARRILDKTPLNFLYLGLVAKALPNASIIHVRRQPMDAAYAMFKTLFRMGYPFTYSFDDLAEYMIAQHQLMAHWRALFPGRIIDVDYEDLVAHQEPASQKLLQQAGLEWQPQVLDFHRNQSPSATASAAQVRQPIHTRSVGLWRHYERELEPLRQRLSDGGLIE